MDTLWTGGINPGNPVRCENCGREYVPASYERPGDRNPCPHCGR